MENSVQVQVSKKLRDDVIYGHNLSLKMVCSTSMVSGDIRHAPDLMEAQVLEAEAMTAPPANLTFSSTLSGS